MFRAFRRSSGLEDCVLHCLLRDWRVIRVISGHTFRVCRTAYLDCLYSTRNLHFKLCSIHHSLNKWLRCVRLVHELILKVKKRCRWLMRTSREEGAQLAQIAENVETVPDVNLVGWALAMVSSRAFKIHGSAKPASMLPLIDLCNHSFNPNCEISPLRNDAEISLVAKQNIPVSFAWQGCRCVARFRKVILC